MIQRLSAAPVGPPQVDLSGVDEEAHRAGGAAFADGASSRVGGRIAPVTRDVDVHIDRLWCEEVEGDVQAEGRVRSWLKARGGEWSGVVRVRGCVFDGQPVDVEEVDALPAAARVRRQLRPPRVALTHRGAVLRSAAETTPSMHSAHSDEQRSSTKSAAVRTAKVCEVGGLTHPPEHDMNWPYSLTAGSNSTCSWLAPTRTSSPTFRMSERRDSCCLRN